MSFHTDEKAQTHLDVDDKYVGMSGDSDSDVPPAYSDVFPNASATVKLQIHAVGYDYNQALTGKTHENIAVHRVDTGELAYTSVRPKKSSNSCALVRSGNDAVLSSTIYRWGPGRPPRMHIFSSNGSGTSVEDAIENDDLTFELVDVKSRSIFSRTQRFATSFGTFEWRYADRAERKAPQHNADSLLICERTDASSSSSGSSSKGKGKGGVPVAQLVRNEELRTPGTTRHMGGNGGRLSLDLSGWAGNAKGGAAPCDVEAFLVASCICMLKREADRFRDNTIAAVV